jgi:hypothetical protein
VPSVSHLYSFRRAATHGAGVDPVAVSADDLNAWMLGKPAHERIGRWVFEEVNRSSAADVDENGAVAPTATDSELVDPKDSRRRNRSHR